MHKSVSRAVDAYFSHKFSDPDRYDSKNRDQVRDKVTNPGEGIDRDRSRTLENRRFSSVENPGIDQSILFQ